MEDQLVEVLRHLYLAITPIACIIFFLYSFICSKVLQKYKSTIFRYLYANLMCDACVMLFGIVMSFTQYFVLNNINIKSWNYMTLVLSISRSITMYSSLLSLVVMAQRYYFIRTQKYFLRKKTSTIISVLGLISFVIFIPFFLTISSRRILHLINISHHLEAQNFSFFDNDIISTIVQGTNLNTLDMIFEAYSIIHIIILILMLISSLLTIQKLIIHRREVLLIKNEFRLANGIIDTPNESDQLNRDTRYREYLRVSFRVTLMIFLISVVFIVINLLIIVYTLCFDFVKLTLNNYKILCMTSHFFYVLLNYVYLLVYYNCDKNIAANLRQPCRFYKEYFFK